PLWAALIARLNQLLGQPVGYFNPLLAGPLAGTCNDITMGSNGAYQAGPGWDACTGWGSPNGLKLLQALNLEWQQHIFYRDTDGAINHIVWDGPSQSFHFDQWTVAAGAPPAAGDPATMVTPNQQHVFYRGADGGINHIVWDGPPNRSTLTGGRLPLGRLQQPATRQLWSLPISSMCFIAALTAGETPSYGMEHSTLTSGGRRRGRRRARRTRPH